MSDQQSDRETAVRATRPIDVHDIRALTSTGAITLPQQQGRTTTGTSARSERGRRSR